MKISEKVDNRTHVSKDRFVEKPSFPTDMKIELTSRCNMKCKFCATKDKKREQGDMEPKMIEVLLNACQYLGVKEVGLFLLGESFLLKDLPKYIALGKKIGIEYLYLTSNGVLCNKKKVQAVMDAGLDSLKISLNAGSKKSFKDITGVNKFKKVLKNIEWIAKNKNNHMNFCVSCVYDDRYELELIKLAKEINQIVDDFYFLSAYNQGGNIQGLHGGNVGRMENPVKNVPCWELFNSSRVTWDGFLSVCSFPHTENFKVGSIKGFTLTNLWHSERMIRLRRAHLKDKLESTICYKCINGYRNN